MKRKHLLFYTGLLCCSALNAQHITVPGQPLEQALRSVEQQAGVTVYYSPQDVAGITVEPAEGEVKDLKVLFIRLLRGTGLNATVSGNAVYVLKNQYMVSQIPALASLQRRQGEQERSSLLENQLQAVNVTGNEEQLYDLDEVTITAGRVDNVRGVEMGVHRLSMEDMKTIPTAFGEMDVLKVVQTLPGVKTMGEGTGGMSVRGGATDQNLILFNDNTVYNPSHLFGFFSAFNGNLVDDMQLYKSSIPARYGGRISSVLDITAKRGNKEKYTGDISVGLLTSSLNLEGPISKGRTSVLLGGRATYSDWILGIIPENSGYRDGSAGFYDANLLLSHNFSVRDNLYLSGYYSSDRFSFEEGQKYAYHNANASVKYVHVFGEDSPLSVTAGMDHYDYSTSDYENANDAYTLKYNIGQQFARIDYLHRELQHHKINAGLNGMLYSVMPGEVKPYSPASIYKADRLQQEKALEAAAYLNEEWEVTDRLSLNAGVRLSLFSAMGPRTFNTYVEGALPQLPDKTGETTESGSFKTYMGPEFRASLRYALTDNLSLKAGVNSMRQYIHKLSNTLVASPTDSWKLSDAYIAPQTGVQYSMGLYRNLEGNNIELSVEGYWKTMDHYLDYRNGARLIMNSHLETDVVPTRGRAYGVEVMAKRSEGKLNGWVSYTYSRTQLQQNDPRITSPINGGGWYNADYDKPHEFKLVGNYRFTQRYSMSLNVDYSTGRPLTLPVSKVYDHTIGAYTFFYTDRNAARIPDYFRMDLAFNIKPTHRITARTHTFLTLGVYNLTGRKNVYSIYFKSEDGDIKGYKMSVFGSPIPYVSFNVKF